MFLIATKQRDASAIDSGGIVVALRNCSLRDQWLQALVTSRVDVTVCWQPSADKSLCHGGGCGDSPVHRNKKTKSGRRRCAAAATVVATRDTRATTRIEGIMRVQLKPVL